MIPPDFITNYVTLQRHWEKVCDERHEGHSREHYLIAQEVERARHIVDDRLAKLNELRSDVEKDRALYITRVEFDALMRGIHQRLGALEVGRVDPSRIVTIEQNIQALRESRANNDGRTAAIAGAIGLTFAALTILLRFWPT